MSPPGLIPELWGVELSKDAKALLSELQKAAHGSAPAEVGALLKDALMLGLNELARRHELRSLDVERENRHDGTVAWPVEPSLRR